MQRAAQAQVQFPQGDNQQDCTECFEKRFQRIWTVGETGKRCDSVQYRGKEGIPVSPD